MKSLTNNLLFWSLLAAGIPAAADKTMPRTAEVNRNDTSVVITPATGEQVRIIPISDRIVRVSITPEEQFPRDTSLIILPHQTNRPAFQTRQNKDEATISTSALQVCVSLKDGTVSFFDPKGKTILSEERSARSFTPIRADSTRAYTTCFSFNSRKDEALYGLGQHQADEFNYKGKNEELFQYNTKVSVPFVVSTAGYGLLWDSYSMGRLGDPRDYTQLHRAFTLYNKEGKEGSLTGTYTHPKQKTLVRDEDSLYFENLKTLKNLPEGFSLNGAKVTFEGELVAHQSGVHKFQLYYAGYVSIYINGQLLLPERWRTAWNPNSHKFSLPMEAGKRVRISIKWEPDGGESYCGLRVLTPRSREEADRLTVWSEMDKQIDYYFISGTDMDEVISGYRTLTGKAPVMPRWAMGYWQSRERYKTQQELLDNLKEFRRRNLPIDNIVQDWSYWPEDAWGSHEFDPLRFPNPKGMVDEVHANHARLMISVWPKFYASTEHFREFDRQGWMYRQAVEDSIRDWIGPGYIGSFYDAYAYGARRLFWKQLKEHLYPLGIDAWWMDASEPNVRDCTDMEYRKMLCGPTALGPSAQYFNAYALMNAHAIYTGLRETEPDRRVFQLTRSGFAGLQRYATATWSGDIASRWEDLKAQIPAGINFSLSGIPFWSMDIGGFCVENRYVKAYKEFIRKGTESKDLREWRELNTRWFQFGTFVPQFRSHGQYPPREPWNIAPEGHPAYESMQYYLKLRYRLMPYIYSMSGGWVHLNDYTPMRALAMDFTADTAVYNIGDQYLFGPSLMVCPVYTYLAKERQVYLPRNKGGWYDFYTGESLPGCHRFDAQAPYGRIPLFVPAGSIIVCGPELQYTGQLPADTLTIHVYQGDDARFTLYEDDGETYAYERGEYQQIPLTYSERNRTLHIGALQGGYPGGIRQRTLKIVATSAKYPRKEIATITYEGNEMRIKLK